jgi:hypothetical protein
MPSIRDLFVRFRLAASVPESLPDPAPTAALEPTANDHHTAITPPVKVDEPPRVIRVVTGPQKPSPRPAPPKARVVRDRPASRRAELAQAMNSQLKADQALWAPELLTPAERTRAALVFWRYRRG